MRIVCSDSFLSLSSMTYIRYQNQMQHQFLYIGKGEVTPEMQFVRGLIDRKVCLFFMSIFYLSLSNYAMSQRKELDSRTSQVLEKQDVILKIKLLCVS